MNHEQSAEVASTDTRIMQVNHVWNYVILACASFLLAMQGMLIMANSILLVELFGIFPSQPTAVVMGAVSACSALQFLSGE